MQYLFAVLILGAGISPLLTFSRLFQVKEWRWDRLREHMRREGWMRQLFGFVRPVVVVLGLCMVIVVRLIGERADVLSWWIFEPQELVIAITLLLLSWFSLFRYVIGRQSKPVWTTKAVLLFTLSFCLFAVASWILSVAALSNLLHPVLLLPLFAFIFVLLAWIILLPVDRFAKALIMSRATKKRLSCDRLTVVGITGSVGKTTTKELLKHILSDRNILSTPAHVNSEIGIAKLILSMLSKEHQIFIVEMGAYRRGEIAAIAKMVKPHIGAITYIGKQHLGLFGSPQDLCKAKGELFAALPPEGFAFLNADMALLDESKVGDCESLMGMASCPVRTVGTGGHTTIEGYDIEELPGGIRFTIGDNEFQVSMHGMHNVANIMLAVGIAEVLGIPQSESAKRLKGYKGMEQTFERKDGKSGQIVLDDTHNASPESFRAAIDWARVFPAKKRVLVTSGLLELGSEEGSIHRELGKNACDVFDEVIFLNKKCAQDFEQGFGKSIRVFPRKKFSLKVEEKMLIVCEGRMSESIVSRLLS